MRYTFCVPTKPVSKSNFDKSFWNDRIVKFQLVFTSIANIVLWILTISKFGYSHEMIPLHFNIIYGVNFVGESRLIYQVAVLGLVIFAMNLLLSQLIYQREKLFSYFLLVGSSFVQIVLLVSLVSLINLNSV